MGNILANDFTNTPYIPYYIFTYLIENNENIWKILEYNTPDCLSMPNLPDSKKSAMLWRGESQETDYKVFFKPLVGDEMITDTTQLRINKIEMNPTNLQLSVNTYEFMFLVGKSISTILYNGIPCPRIDVLESEILKTFNGIENLGTIGLFQFNNSMSRNCRARLNINNGKNYFGGTLCLSGMWGNLVENKKCE